MFFETVLVSINYGRISNSHQPLRVYLQLLLSFGCLQAGGYEEIKVLTTLGPWYFRWSSVWSAHLLEFRVSPKGNWLKITLYLLRAKSRFLFHETGLLCAGYVSFCVTVKAARVGVRMQVLDRVTVVCVFTLCLGSLHSIALKSQLFTRHGGLPYSTKSPVTYKTFYFDQKVSLKISLHTVHRNGNFIFFYISLHFYLKILYIYS